MPLARTCGPPSLDSMHIWSHLRLCSLAFLMRCRASARASASPSSAGLREHNHPGTMTPAALNDSDRLNLTCKGLLLRNGIAGTGHLPVPLQQGAKLVSGMPLLSAG